MSGVRDPREASVCAVPLSRCGVNVTGIDEPLVIYLCMEHFPLWAAWQSVVRDPRLETVGGRRRARR